MTEKMKFNCARIGTIASSSAMTIGSIYAAYKLFNLRKDTNKSVKVLKIIAGVLVLIFAITCIMSAVITAVLFNYDEYYCDDSFDADYYDEPEEK